MFKHIALLANPPRIAPIHPAATVAIRGNRQPPTVTVQRLSRSADPKTTPKLCGTLRRAEVRFPPLTLQNIPQVLGAMVARVVEA
jgi:hypothetical protein